MAKQKISIPQRVQNKLVAKLSNGVTIDEAAEYICHTARSFRDNKSAIYSRTEKIDPVIAEKARILDREITKRTSEKLEEENRGEDKDTISNVKK